MATQVIGEGVIKVTAEASGVAGAMAQVRADAKATGESVRKAMSEGSKDAAKGLDAYIAKLQQSADNIGKTAREVTLLKLANQGATQAQLQTADALLRTVEAGRQQQAIQREAARSAAQLATAQTAAAAAVAKGTSGYFQLAAGQKLSAYQAQQLSFQLNDLFVQIASGQSPITALIQQGSQLNGQFGGFGGTLRALGTLFNPVTAAIAAAVVVISALNYALFKGAQQSADFAKFLTLTGNAAGITEGQFNAAAKSIATSTNTTIGSTRETLQALVASGRFSGAALDAAARATQGLSKVTGQETSKIVSDFVSMSGNVAKGAEELNNKYNFLTATQLRYIKTLEETGQEQQALAVLFKALDGRVSDSAQNLGTLESAWQAVKNAASGAINAMLQIGRVKTVEDKISDIRKEIDRVREGDFQQQGGNKAYVEGLQEQIRLLKHTQIVQSSIATTQAEQVERERQKNELYKISDQFQTNAQKRAKEIGIIEARAAASRKGENNPAELAKIEEAKQKAIAGVRERYKDPKGPKPKKPVDTERRDDKAELLLRIEDIKSTGAAVADAFSNQERILEAQKSASLISEEAYYREKNNILVTQSNLQIDTLKKINAELEKETFKGDNAKKDALDRDRQVVKNTAEITKLRATAATQQTILAIQAEEGYKKVALALLQAREAAQSYFDVTQRGYDQEIANIGKGDRQRNLDQATLQIRERYEAQRQALAADLRRGQITAKQHEDELAIINEFQGKAIGSYQAYYTKLRELQEDWRNGATEALQNYADDALDVAGQTKEAFSNAFKSMEDDIVNFSKTGKLSFKSFAESVLNDWARMNAKQITGPIAAALNGSISGGSSGGSSGGGGLFSGLLSFLFKGGSSSAGPQISSMGTSSLIPGVATGTNFVPHDMLAVIHKGEAVIPAYQNAEGRAGGSAKSISITINPPAGMSRETSNQFAAKVARGVQLADARFN